MNSLLSYNSFMFQLIGIAGIMSHVVAKILRGELNVSVLDYFFRVNRKSTGLMLMASIGGISTAILGGQLTDIQVGAQVLAAWGIGYASDSALNKQI